LGMQKATAAFGECAKRDLNPRASF